MQARAAVYAVVQGVEQFDGPFTERGAISGLTLWQAGSRVHPPRCPGGSGTSWGRHYDVGGESVP
jgi:hypothetical protein